MEGTEPRYSSRARANHHNCRLWIEHGAIFSSVRYLTAIRCLRYLTAIRCLRYLTEIRCLRYLTEIRCICDSEKGVQLWVEEQSAAENWNVNWTRAGQGYPKGTGPYHVGARVFAQSVLQRLNVVRSETLV